MGFRACSRTSGSSLGTALIGSILIGALATSFASGVAESNLPDETKAIVSTATDGGVDIVPVRDVADIGAKAGLTEEESAALTTVYRESQVAALRVAFFGLVVISLVALLFSGGIPAEAPERRQKKRTQPA